MNLAFVYGTLKKGEPNHHLLENEDNGFKAFIGIGQSVQKFPLVIASRHNIPYVLDCSGTGNQIKGEIYKVDDEMLKHLDKLEDNLVHYHRTLHDFELIKSSVEDVKDGEMMKCGIYLLKNYKEELLKLPFLTEYSTKNDLSLPYIKRSERTSLDNYYGDVKHL